MTHASNASCFYFPSVHVHGCITAFVPLSLAHSRCQCSSNRLCEQVSKSVTQNHTCWESKGCSLITSNWFSPWNKPNNVASSSAGSTLYGPAPSLGSLARLPIHLPVQLLDVSLQPFKMSPQVIHPLHGLWPGTCRVTPRQVSQAVMRCTVNHARSTLPLMLVMFQYPLYKWKSSFVREAAWLCQLFVTNLSNG